MAPHLIRFSSRTGWPAHLNPISSLLEEKRLEGPAILDLTESNPTRCRFKFYNKKDLSVLSDPKNLSYEPDPRGLIEAREAVCRYYAENKIQLDPEQIFLTSGTSEAYGFLFHLLTDAGDDILTAEPSYPLFSTLADLSDVCLKKFSMVYHETWRMDLRSLERSFTTRAKALLVVHPNNPTGHFISAEERIGLNSILNKKACSLIVDEVFLDAAWNLDQAPVSFVGQSEVLTFTLSGISKIMGLPQMKLSWIVVSGPDALREEALRRLELIADAYLSVNTPSQRALGQWMDERHAAIKEINERVRDNYHDLEKNTRGIRGFQLLKTEGGWYSVLKGPDSMNDEHFVVRLLQNKNVLIHPGFFFDFFGENFLVVSLLPDKDTFREGAQRLCEAMKDFSKI